MDDFLYSEPLAVPEPSTLTLIAFGVFALLGLRRSRRATA
jgi:hypothetical protein